MRAAGWGNTCYNEAWRWIGCWDCREAVWWWPPRWRAGCNDRWMCWWSAKSGIHGIVNLPSARSPNRTLSFLTRQPLVTVPVPRGQLDKVVAEEMARLREYRACFHGSDPPLLHGRNVLVRGRRFGDGRDGRGGGGFGPKSGGAPGDHGRAGGLGECRRTIAARGGRSAWRCWWTPVLKRLDNIMTNFPRRMTKRLSRCCMPPPPTGNKPAAALS